jgi:hypothetical protein
MGLRGRQETGPDPPEAQCYGRSLPLTAVKLKETLPDFGLLPGVATYVVWIAQ